MFYFFLVHGDNVPISVIRKFVHILEITDQDYEEEIGTNFNALIFFKSPFKHKLQGILESRVVHEAVIKCL